MSIAELEAKTAANLETIRETKLEIEKKTQELIDAAGGNWESIANAAAVKLYILKSSWYTDARCFSFLPD
jgi:hypothetical protein